MARNWVVNASPLIVLGKIDRLALLDGLTDSLVVPSAVASEIEHGPSDDPARAWLTGDGCGYLKDVVSVDPIVAGWDLGYGESHVLSWAARNKGYEAILDDRASRKCAASLSIPVRGTLGVLLLAKQESLLDRLAPVLGEVKKAGLRISPDLVAKMLDLAGESP